MCIGGPCKAAIDGPGGGTISREGGPSVLLWMVLGGTVYVTVDGPGGPSIVPWMVRGDHVWGGPILV